MAVIRTRKDSDPSGEVPSGAGTGNTPVTPPDRTKSVVKSQVPAVRRPRTPGRAAIPGGTSAATSSGASGSFVQDTITELKRVEWPSKDKVRAGTIVTIGLLIFFSLYIFGLDFLAERFFMLLGFYGK
jgi:preprotein translocase SecE subunit